MLIFIIVVSLIVYMMVKYVESFRQHLNKSHLKAKKININSNITDETVLISSHISENLSNDLQISAYNIKTLISS